MFGSVQKQLSSHSDAVFRGSRRSPKLPLLAFALTLALAAGQLSGALAREHHNHDSDVARSALQRGEVLPISKVLALAAQYLPGDVVEVRLDPKRSGDLLYRIRVLTHSGQIQELVLDARTGMFIRIED